METKAMEPRRLGAAEAWNARRGETRRLPPGRYGIRVGVEKGLLVVTQAGDPEDHLLGPGGELELHGPGLGVAWALEASRAVIVRGGGKPASAPRQGGVSRAA